MDLENEDEIKGKNALDSELGGMGGGCLGLEEDEQNYVDEGGNFIYGTQDLSE